jgi:hypothetical protein
MYRHHDILAYLWQAIEHAVDKMSVTQVAAIGGAGSIISAATAAVPDFSATNAWLQMLTAAGGFIGMILSVALLALKIALTWRNRNKPSL